MGNLVVYADLSKQGWEIDNCSMRSDLASCDLEEAVRQPHPSDKRGKIIILTERGWSCIREAESILSHLEAQWAAIIGIKRMGELQTDLRQLVMMANGGTLPQKFRPLW